MCGRYSLHTDPATLTDRFGVDFDEFQPRYNCAPGQELPVVTDGGVERMEWGFTPSWADESFDLINARAETVAEKRSFADAYESRRCLVPATGFYEWTDRGDGKRPYRVAFEDDRPFAMAGIHERWRPATRQAGLGEFGTDGETDDEPRETFAVLTTAPNELIADLHDRMAVILPPERESDWLAGDDDETLFEPYDDAEMHAYPVSTAVNSPANDEPSLLDRVETA